MNAFRFYFCTLCGAMSVKNFRDTYCRVCGAPIKPKMVEVRGETEETLLVTETEAPHIEELER